MHLKHAIITLGCLLSLLLLNSCLGDDNRETVIISEDAQIYSFSLSSDSVSELASVVFTIDQLNGRIFNQDSMSFGTEFEHKAVITFGLASTYATFEVVGDTLYSSKDSIDISSKKLQFKTTSADGGKTKYYDFAINVHTVDPDSVHFYQTITSVQILNAEETKAIVFGGETYVFTKNSNMVSLYKEKENWASIALSGFPGEAKLRNIQVGESALYVTDGNGKLYVSYNIKDWQAINTPYKIQALLGYFYESYISEAGLSVIMEHEGKNVFAFSSDLVEWETGADVAAGFPIKDFESQSYSTMKTQRIALFGGTDSSGEMLNSVWSTEDGLYWVKINSTDMSFPVLEKFNALVYNEEMFVMNGRLKDGSINKEVYHSPDGGNTWRVENKVQPPADYTGRYDASLIKDADEVYFYILGGKNNGYLTDIWMGYKNKYLFVD